MNDKNIYKKTRLAPTPSGYLHLGNAYSFIYTAAFAQHSGAKLFLRIDDLDRERIRPEYVQDIFDTLDFLNISWDEGPRNVNEYEKEYSQVHRLSLYNEALEKLKDDGRLYACTCSRSQLGEMGKYEGNCRDKKIPFDAPEVNWRLRTTDASDIQVRLVEGDFATKPYPLPMHDLIVRKKDGYPAYQLASVVDDLHYGIDLIIRGADLWDSTLAQIYLANKMGKTSFADTTFSMHQLLLTGDGQKLSKSAGDTSIHYLRQQGKKSADIYEMIGNMIGAQFPTRNLEDFRKHHGWVKKST